MSLEKDVYVQTKMSGISILPRTTCFLIKFTVSLLAFSSSQNKLNMINQCNSVTNLLNWLVPWFLWTDPRLSDWHQEGASETPDPNLFKKSKH